MSRPRQIIGQVIILFIGGMALLYSYVYFAGKLSRLEGWQDFLLRTDLSASVKACVFTTTPGIAAAVLVSFPVAFLCALFVTFGSVLMRGSLLSLFSYLPLLPLVIRRDSGANQIIIGEFIAVWIVCLLVFWIMDRRRASNGLHFDNRQEETRL